ncbi:MAG TPA: MarR family transcriptional regulator [Dehalococcoidia bacterium]|nr:MarR family transcriptional regulator [Dehalococcoidia bacterium]
MERPPAEPDIDAKIAAAIERLSRVSRVLLQDAVKRRGLSPIQALMLTYLDTRGPEVAHVSHLAREFGLTQATVSDSVSSLEAKGLVLRERSLDDGRMTRLRLTPAGRRLAQELAMWDEPLREAVAAASPLERERALFFLLELIGRLQRRGVISVARVCVTCRFFERDAHPDPRAPHHCNLLDRPLPVSGLRVDCPEYEAA